MNHMDAYDREIGFIEEEHEAGAITDKERDERLLDLQRDYRAEADEAACEAARNELQNW